MLPTLTLPKGGGALRGIDESFQVNPATGTGTLTIPIPISPGRGGFGPKLALRYDSGAGNGPYGLGWDLGVPSIRRKTDRGIPRYDDSDIFTLAGTDDLVPALREHEGVWVPEIVDDLDYTTRRGERYEVRRYRPRTEGLFARIEQWVRRSDGDIHWRVITKDNQTSIYGETLDGRISKPGDPRCVFQWFLERTYDDKGNIVAYQYKAEDGAGIDPRRPEEARGRARTQRYLKRVRYGNSRPYLAHLTSDFDEVAWSAENRWCFELCFDYGEHPGAEPTLEERDDWPVRLDAFSSYRAGFEIRTYRLCRRILMFHRFPELGPEPVLVRSTRLTYDHEDRGNPIATQLVAVTHVGHEPGRSPAELPPLRLAYSAAIVEDTVHTLASDELLLDGQWLDLDGEGISGRLSRRPEAWRYQRNLGDGRLAAAEVVSSVPSIGNTGMHAFQDIGGTGRPSLVARAGGIAGRSTRGDDGDWLPFRTFSQLPNVDWDDPNIRFIDLTGDGHPDLLVTEHECLVWRPGNAEGDYGAPQRIAKALDEADGPTIAFADSTQTIFIADMSGDGLADLVRIRNGEVCYWPNTGYGTFGAKITMDGAPVFDHPEAFDPRRIRLGDLDGTGTADVVYLGRDCTRFWRNESGNRLGPAQLIAQFPRVDNIADVQLVDLLGRGTACLVWQSALPDSVSQPLRYIALMSQGKPYLLTEIDNGMGALTRIRYAPSTKFYLEDRAAGRPWVTRLPFPVHVVERSETYDAISRNRFVTRYAYHHGYYDGEEREFRGFGLVEQWDAEHYAERGEHGLFPLGDNELDETSHVPPVLTRTWFHTGAYFDRERISRHYEHEYYAGDAAAWRLPDTTLPEGLTANEQRDALRALRGRKLRQEIYALDGTERAPHPYVVTEATAHVRLEQPRVGDRSAVFFVCDSETLTYHYERDPADPRITHALVLEVDRFGHQRRSASVAYPRRGVGHLPEQQRMYVTLAEDDLLDLASTPWTYRTGLPFERRRYEVEELAVPDGPWTIAALRDAIDTAPRRLLARSRARYYRNTLDGPLGYGEVESLAIVYEEANLAFTPTILEDPALGGRFTPAVLRDAGYRNDVDEDPSHWWIPSRRPLFDPATAPANFYLPIGSRDPFGATSYVTYDRDRLLVEATTDALGYETRARNDYRVLAPAEIVDPNGNGTRVAFDALGFVIATAVFGKDGEGDTLADPTTRLEYDLFAYERTRHTARPQPAYVRTLARERHGDPSSPWTEMYTYSDGFGRVVLQKAQAEDGLAPMYDAAGELVTDDHGAPLLAHTSDRWIGNGATVFDNKGNAVRTYEPFFDSGPGYTDEHALTRIGVAPTVHYDPLGRAIRTTFPDGTLARVDIDPWRQVAFDPNDAVLGSPWHDAKSSPSASAEERDAAANSAAHDGTPTVTHLDVLGRPFVTVAHNRKDGRDEYIPTRTVLDIEGRPLAISDGRRSEGLTPSEAARHVGNLVMTYTYALGDLLLHQNSMDAGPRWMLVDVMGAPAYRWDARGHCTRTQYDALRRPTHRWVDLPGDDGPTTILRERIVYGESLTNTDAVARNLLGQVVLQFDGAGLLETHAYDFKGRALMQTRRLANTYRSTPEWSTIDGLAPTDMIASAPLEAEAFTTSARYDAFGRIVESTAPDGSVYIPGYNKANLLESIGVRIRGATTPTPIVVGIDYNARGQRTRIQYGSGADTTYTYDAATFRLAHLRTTKPGSPALQDLHYTYDAAGNVTELRDDAVDPIYFRNARVDGRSRYTYDALYRLIEASGRESAASARIPDHEQPSVQVGIPAHDEALRTYTERYTYDPVGNILELHHDAPGGSWTRTYEYEATSNRLIGHDLEGGAVARYSYDAHGSMLAMPHLAAMSWNEKDELVHAVRGTDNEVYFTYDANGQRVRKVWMHGGWRDERIYLAGFEIYRRYAATGTEVHDELETLHVMDGNTRVCMIEMPTIRDRVRIATPSPRFRYQLTNHLGSTTVETDEHADVLTYEVYHPYGTTAYHARNGTIQVSAKRYRYTGMERDEETSLGYHTARYYAPWIGRWISADPIGIEGGMNLYAYARGNPLRHSDSGGQDPWDEIEARAVQIQADTTADINQYRQLTTRLSQAEHALETATNAGDFARVNRLLDEVAYLRQAQAVLADGIHAAIVQRQYEVGQLQSQVDHLRVLPRNAVPHDPARAQAVEARLRVLNHSLDVERRSFAAEALRLASRRPRGGGGHGGGPGNGGSGPGTGGGGNPNRGGQSGGTPNQTSPGTTPSSGGNTPRRTPSPGGNQLTPSTTPRTARNLLDALSPAGLRALRRVVLDIPELLGPAANIIGILIEVANDEYPMALAELIGVFSDLFDVIVLVNDLIDLGEHIKAAMAAEEAAGRDPMDLFLNLHHAIPEELRGDPRAWLDEQIRLRL